MGLERKKPLKADPEKTKKWIQDSRKPLPKGDKTLKRTEFKRQPIEKDGKPTPDRDAWKRRKSEKKKAYEKELNALTPELLKRSRGMCEVSVSPQCNGRTEHRHHRKVGRGKGTNTLAGLLYVCNACHSHIHLHVTESRGLGYLVKSSDDPAEIPWSRRKKLI